MTGLLRSLGASFVAIVCVCTIGGSACAQSSPLQVIDLTHPARRPQPKAAVQLIAGPPAPRADVSSSETSIAAKAVSSATAPNSTKQITANAAVAVISPAANTPTATATSSAQSTNGTAAPPTSVQLPPLTFQPALAPAHPSLAIDPPSFPPGSLLPGSFAPGSLPPKYTHFNGPLPGLIEEAPPSTPSGSPSSSVVIERSNQEPLPGPTLSDAAASDTASLPPETTSTESLGNVPSTTSVQSVPPLTEPYWVREVVEKANAAGAPVAAIAYEQTIWDALAHSPYVKAVQLVPQINEARIAEANGLFDPTPFVDSIFNDNSDPVGNTLTTGGPSRLNERRIDNGLGLRAKNQLGGSTELTQNMTMRDNNSVFLAPKQQADTKLLLKMNQPLMRGAGRTYATSSVRIAELSVGISQHEATRKLQLHAQQIASAYWNLYAARAVEMQSERGRQRLTALRDELQKRAEVDGLESQLKRAEAALARQSSNLARAQADVVAASANLRALVNSPEISSADLSVFPVTSPIDQPFQVERVQELEAALSFHPDLLAARDRIRSAMVRLKVAENELRPTLNLVMEGYLRGLNGDYDVGNSIADQFSQGRPAYSGGLSYQRPYRNLISKSILKQRRLEMQQLLFDLDNTMLVVTADVDQAIASVKATYAELEASVKSTLAFDEEVRYLDARWRNAFVESTGPSLLLDELLNAQNQLIQSENAWARAQAEHMIAFAKLHVATGALLNSMKIAE